MIGSGDAAIEEGMFLTRFANKVMVSVLHDEGKVDCNEIAKAAAFANPKMEFIWNTVVDSFEGGEELTKVNLKNLKTGEIIPVETEHCFLFIGFIPNTDIYKDIIEMTQRGYIITDEEMKTNMPGVLQLVMCEKNSCAKLPLVWVMVQSLV